MITGLPRSVRDHMTNQLSFGPDGAIYFNQGANTAMGAPDNAWGLRSEHLLNGANPSRRHEQAADQRHRAQCADA
jgi:glucose/arabinose dehydrogenase